MKSIKDSIQERPVSKIKSERGLIMSDFISYLEGERGRPYSKNEVRFVCVKTSHVSVPDLKFLYAQCRRYNKEGKGAFSKCFWGSLKVRK